MSKRKIAFESFDDLIERSSGQPEMYMCAVCGAIIDENYTCEHIKELIPYIQEFEGMNETILEIYADYYKVKKEKHNTHEEYVEAIKKMGERMLKKMNKQELKAREGKE